MDKWSKKVALVTGASVGIGSAICRELVHYGVTVVGAARNVQQIQDISKELVDQPGSLYAIKCDLTKDEEVYAMFEEIKKKHGGVDICINNAGKSYNHSLLDGETCEWRDALNLNVVAMCLCSKLAVASLRERQKDFGHIINIGSMSGYRFGDGKESHFYIITKQAVRAFNEGLRRELRELKCHIRATGISPGNVDTEFPVRMAHPSPRQISSFEELTAKDIADAVIYALSVPERVEINDILIRPTEQTS